MNTTTQVLISNSRTNAHMNAQNQPILNNLQGKEALKKQFVHCLQTIAQSATTLRNVVVALIELGGDRPELVRWAAEAGYSPGYARTLLSKILCDAGLRARKPGAGPPTPQEALVILAFAHQRYGEDAAKLLRAAARAAKAQAAAKTTQAQGELRVL